MWLETVVALVIGCQLSVAGEDVLTDRSARTECWILLSKAQWGMSHQEQASFIIRMPCGKLTFVRWPAPEEANVQRYRGIPRGTVAIAHTHPNWLPMPSAIDRGTAKTAHVPVYVVTRSMITLTDGRRTRVIVDGEWSPASVL
ncbi:MAG TPA: Mov34/MPN/PAD-1 family protein [Vicinamibacterales bacterium]